MPDASALDQTSFRRILARNITLPLAGGGLSALIFVALILYLLSELKSVDHSQRVIGNTNEISKLAVDMESGIRGFVITGDENFLSSYDTARPGIKVDIAALAVLVGDNPTQVTRLDMITKRLADWDLFAQDAIMLRRQGGDAVGMVRSGRGKLQFDLIRTELSLFLDVEQRLRRERMDSARDATINVVVLYLILILSITGLLAFLGRRDLMRLSAVYGSTLSEHQLHAALLERQAWQRSGQSRLASRNLGQMTMPQLGHSVLDFLAGTIDVTVGALYVRQIDGSLQRAANYGLSNDDAQLGRTVGPGEGLVGQAALGVRLLRLDAVPDNYLKVSSGLGRASPRHVLLLPLTHDGEVNGVLELGFLQAPAERSVELLELLAASIGSALQAAMYRARLQEVLAETQQLNEEMQAQQEELRASNDELEEQSRALEVAQVVLENQKAELEQSNHQLGMQAVVLDQKNSDLGIVQAELEERATELQRASNYKSEFLANMSHELRTPLNSSLILARLLADNRSGNLNDEQIRFAETIYSAGNDLLDLINDILDISKVEAGKLELAPDVIPLEQLMASLRMTFEPMTRQKQLGFSAQLAADAPASFFADRQRVEQILKNLLSNAIKFTGEGQVALTVHQQADGRVGFAVSDSGIGIAADQQEVIFEAFRQADGTTSRRYGGTGLGLSISRDLAALLGGEITLASVAGEGSTFTLVLPAMATLAPVAEPVTVLRPPSAVAAARATPAPVPAPAPAAPPAAFSDDRQHLFSDGRTLLVIEDDADFARILFDLAHDMQYQCLVAHGATEGLEMAGTFLPDAVLLDLGLPDGSGMAVLQCLKADPATRHIPVHIISGSDRARTALQQGAAGYVTKPATRARLEQIFTQIEGQTTQTVKRVLLVEDDVRQRESMVHLIGDDDVEITAVASGEEAMALLHSVTYDCMIIDLSLPDMQGHELLQRMGTDLISAFPPVIVYTGRNLTREEETSLQKYSRSIIIKGARSPERLLDEVTLFLHKVESELSLERQGMLRAARSRDRVFEGRRVLLVDDDVRNIFSMTSALEHQGLEVVVGRNGFEAISQLELIADIDMVLMDVMMPGMDGLEATRRIRADARFRHLPIIAITAKAMKDDQEHCINAGASDYLAKPVDLDRLYSLLRVWLPNMERL
ncbi:response regulator [Actimicrobium sp. CCC2.4]|uniref:response regulator n=1 Tax=Actimicrobium sp. CCC2.4 TaxID=3048606 RepID=UPI002AC8FD54|nr:response regulator [Actimicrobium sp. CCC2.4]MEB0135082.1 response regulator [Actimicrobium sp. CCC2.4]WPX31871.1 response regulator [Actimicrobium sp. CCC2.4]